MMEKTETGHSAIPVRARRPFGRPGWLLVLGGSCLAGSALVAAAAVFQGQPPQNADFPFGPTAQPAQTFTNGTVDLPAPREPQDPKAELTGSLCNQFAAARRICGISMWVEDQQGNILQAVGGGPVADGLKANDNASGGLKSATPAGSSGGVQAYNLEDCISKGACGTYELQMKEIASPPNRWTVRMSSSSEKAGVHYDSAGQANFSRAGGGARIFDAPPRSVRTGVTFDVINADSQSSITSLRITMITNGPARIAGGQVDDLLDGSPLGNNVVVDADGLGATISGLNQPNPNGVMVWLTLTSPIDDPTAFRVKATFLP